MMRPAIRSFITPDAPSPEEFVPPVREEGWSMLIQALVGPDDGPGEESFDIEVCTPAWFTARFEEGWPPLPGYGRLIVATYDWPQIEHTLRRHISSLTAPTWHELALKLSRLGGWEFEDYADSKDTA